MSNAECSTAREVPPIERELNALDESLSELNRSTDELRARLSSVLAPKNAEGKADNAVMAPLESGRLSARLAARRRRISDVCGKLNEMTQALEI